MIGVGTDLVDLDRFRKSLERTPGLKRRCFTAAEQAYSERRRDPIERYAVRFAAKEAVMKALGVGLGSCEFTDIEVIRSESGQPSVRLHGHAAALAAERDVVTWHLSLTHTETAAHAVAVAE